MKWKPGDRVQRELYIDNGTWKRKGDKCLPSSPVRTGTVRQILRKPGYRGVGIDVLAVVEWDQGPLFPGEECRYFEHGLASHAQQPQRKVKR